MKPDIERTDQDIAIVRISNPPANRLSAELLQAVAAAANDFQVNTPKAVIITGVGGTFSLGGDDDLFTPLFDGAAGAGWVHDTFRAAFDAVAKIPCVTIAALDGHAAAGGFELALSCDFRIATAETTLALPEVPFGIIPGAGGTQRLSRLVGVGRALDIILTGRAVSAAEALAIGLISRVAGPGETALAQAVALARSFLERQPSAFLAAKRAVHDGYALPLASAIDEERRQFIAAVSAEDGQKALHALAEAVSTGTLV